MTTLSQKIKFVGGREGRIWASYIDENPQKITYSVSLHDIAGKDILNSDEIFDTEAEAEEYLSNKDLMIPLTLFEIAADTAMTQAKLYRKFGPLF